MPPPRCLMVYWRRVDGVSEAFLTADAFRRTRLSVMGLSVSGIFYCAVVWVMENPFVGSYDK